MTARSIQIALLTMALVLVLTPLTTAQNPPHFLLRAVDASTSSLPTAGPNNFGNCILVLPDGRFYLSLRRQEIMGGTIIVKSLQGSLDVNALERLRELLNQQTIRDAPKFELPNTPFGADEFQVFEAQIDRGSALQHAGYFKWKGKGPDNSDSTKKQWQDSETALQPLVGWFRALKTYKEPAKLPTSQSHVLQCDLDHPK